MPDYNKIMREKRIASGVCVSCGKIPPVENRKECNSCQEIRSERQKKQYHSRKDKLTEKKKIQRDLWRSQGDCYNCGKKSDGKPRCQSCRNVQKHRIQKMKDKCYEYYGGYSCNCCGEKTKEFLVLDHTNNDGAAHRKLLGSKNNGCGLHMYTWIIKNNFPSIFQVLCANCNTGKQRNGGICPHKLIV